MVDNNRICPLMDGKSISEDECYENCMIAERYFKPDRLPENVNAKKDFREICLACEHHNID